MQGKVLELLTPPTSVKVKERTPSYTCREVNKVGPTDKIPQQPKFQQMDHDRVIREDEKQANTKLQRKV